MTAEAETYAVSCSFCAPTHRPRQPPLTFTPSPIDTSDGETTTVVHPRSIGAISIPGGRGFSRSPRRGRSVPEKATVSSSVKMRLAASPAWSATDDTGEGVLVIELERRAAGGPGPDLEPSCGAQSAHWIRSDRAPDAPGPKSSYMKTKTTPIRRYCSGCSCSAVRF